MRAAFVVLTGSVPLTAGWVVPGGQPQALSIRSLVSSRSKKGLGQRRRRAAAGAPCASTADPSVDYDVAIIGAGPAALSLAALLGASPAAPKVVVLSQNLAKRWVPNYGCWTEEWAALDALYTAKGVPGLMGPGVDARWGDTDCFFGEGEDGRVQAAPEGDYRRELGRAYLRVSRAGLKAIFYDEGEGGNKGYECIKEDVAGKALGTNVFGPDGSGPRLLEGHTELTLASSGKKVTAKIVVDACGAESPFTIRDDRDKEGYQIAYGVECTVKGPGVTGSKVGDYDRAKMTLFDYRSEAWRTSPGIDPNKVVNEPTFNYVMPLAGEKVFFEETSLVANPAVSFEDCKRRLAARLSVQGVQIDQIFEEEFCYIPMGGAVPRRGQRVVPVGAAAGIVHPSTGYQLGRCLSSNLGVADQILAELAKDPAADTFSQFDPDGAAARVIGRTWTPAAVGQRNFALFGGDFLMQQDVEGLKGFFSGFFKLDEPVWAGFLAGWRGLPNNEYHDGWLPRLWFGVTFLVKLPPKVALAMVVAIAKYSLAEGPDLIQSVTPLFGDPEPLETTSDFAQHTKGDEAAKCEAMRMMAASPAEE